MTIDAQQANHPDDPSNPRGNCYSGSLNRIPKEHDLKIWQRHFEAVLSGKKKAEHRVNDRDFQEGDTLLLREVTEPECEYTGRKLYVTITHIIRGGEMDILSIEPQDTVSPREIRLDFAALHDALQVLRQGQVVDLPAAFKRAVEHYLQATKPVSSEVDEIVDCLKYAVADLKGLLGITRSHLQSYHILSVEGTIHDATEALAAIGAKHGK